MGTKFVNKEEIESGLGDFASFLSASTHRKMYSLFCLGYFFFYLLQKEIQEDTGVAPQTVKFQIRNNCVKKSLT